MEENKRRIAILGSTGSIGTQALDVISRHPDLFQVEMLSAGSNAELLIAQARQFNPNAVVICNKDKYAQVKTALDLLEVDALGLDRTDRLILRTMADRFLGRQVGLDTLAAAIGEDSGTIEDVYEPFLIQRGLIKRTPRGRALTETAYRHLGLEVPDELF